MEYKNRNPVDNNVLKMLQEMETNPELLFDSQQYLYRSRIVHSKDKLNGEYVYSCRARTPNDYFSRIVSTSVGLAKKGAVSKRLKQAMRGSAFFRNIFGQAKTECRKNGTQGIIFMRNFQVE